MLATKLANIGSAEKPELGEIQSTASAIGKDEHLRRTLAKKAVQQVQSLRNQREKQKKQRIDDEEKRAKAITKVIAAEIRKFWQGCLDVVKHEETRRDDDLARKKRMESLEDMVSRTEALSNQVSSQLARGRCPSGDSNMNGDMEPEDADSEEEEEEDEEAEGRNDMEEDENDGDDVEATPEDVGEDEEDNGNSVDGKSAEKMDTEASSGAAPAANGDSSRFKNALENLSAKESDDGTFDRHSVTQKVTTPVPVLLLRHPIREYQHVGLHWLAALHDKGFNGLLADEMGLGKTIQTICLMAHLAISKEIWGPHLIIVPTSVQLNWEMEFKKWAPGLKILCYYGSQKERKQKRVGWQTEDAFHVCIVSYTVVLQDYRMFRKKQWYYMVLDEAQHIKNFRSQRWQALLHFNTERRLLLTGTPLQNDLMELWSLMHFLMPDVFGSYSDFKAWFSDPLSLAIQKSSVEKEGGLISRLHEVLRPFMLRRLKSEVEKQMPQKYEVVEKCPLSRRQQVLYDEFMQRRETQHKLKQGDYLGMMSIMMQLRKVCNHPELFEQRHVTTPFSTPAFELAVPGLIMLGLWSGIGGRKPGEDNFCSLLLPIIALWHYEVTQFRRSSASCLDFHILRAASPKIACQKQLCVHISDESAAGGPPLKRIRFEQNGKKMSRAAPTITELFKRQSEEAVSGHFDQVSMLQAAPLASVLPGAQASPLPVEQRVPFPLSDSSRSLWAEAYRQDARQSRDRRRKRVRSEAAIGKLCAEVCSDRPIWGADGLALLTLLSDRNHCGYFDIVGSPISRSRTLDRATRPRRNTLPDANDIGTANSPSASSSHSAAVDRWEWRLRRRRRRWWEESCAVDSLCRAIQLDIEKNLESTLCPWVAFVPRAQVLHCSRRVLIFPANAQLGSSLPGTRRAGIKDDNRPWRGAVVNRDPPLTGLHMRIDAQCPPDRMTWWRSMQWDEVVALEEGRRARLCSEPPVPLKTLMISQFPEKHYLESDCGKLKRLATLLHKFKARGDKCIIFTQFSKMLDVLETFVNYHHHTYLRLDGTVKTEKRQNLVDRFNMDDRVFLFIASTRAGGVGINLTGANVVIFYDSDWNPAIDRQATDRAHRIGQTRDVYIHRLISEHTIEENIWKRQLQKRQLDDVVVDGGRFDTETLQGSSAGPTSRRVQPWTVSDVRSMLTGGSSGASLSGSTDVRAVLFAGGSVDSVPGTADAEEAEGGISLTEFVKAQTAVEDPDDAEMAEGALKELQEEEQEFNRDFSRKKDARSTTPGPLGDGGKPLRKDSADESAGGGGGGWLDKLPPLVRWGVKHAQDLGLSGVALKVVVSRSKKPKGFQPSIS